MFDQKEYMRQWKINNPDKVKANAKKTRERRKAAGKKNKNYPRSTEVNRRKYNRRKSNPMYRAMSNLRSRLHKIVRYDVSGSSRSIGCTAKELRSYLESKFTSQMTWDNYGDWHIDHICPLSSATSEDELKSLAHYTNLQPMWAKDNVMKHASTSHLSSPWPRIA